VIVRSYEERTLGESIKGGDTKDCAIVEIASSNDQTVRYGLGLDDSILSTSFGALFSGVNRLSVD
jgi:hypothetical protein